MAARDFVERSFSKRQTMLRSVSKNLYEQSQAAFLDMSPNRMLCDILENEGFHVQWQHEDPAAFRAEYVSPNGEDGPVVALICEFDSGGNTKHKCGHNLIAIGGLGTALAIRDAMLRQKNVVGRVVVIGCAEEGQGGGKVKLLVRGAFLDTDVLGMIHPTREGALFATTLCSATIDVTVQGRRVCETDLSYDVVGSTMDAVAAIYVNLSLLRSHFDPAWRLSVIITKCGTAGVIPEEMALSVLYRAHKGRHMTVFRDRILHCIHMTASSLGCAVETESSLAYFDMWNNHALCSRLLSYLDRPEDLFCKDLDREYVIAGSTDMGNVSQEVPSIQVFYGLHSKPDPEAADAALEPTTDDAYCRTIICAQALTLTLLDVYKDPEFLDDVRREFQTRRGQSLASPSSPSAG